MCSMSSIRDSANIYSTISHSTAAGPAVMSGSLAATLLTTLTTIAAKFKQQQIDCPLSNLLHRFLATWAAKTGDGSGGGGTAVSSKPVRSSLSEEGGGGSGAPRLDVTSESLENDIKQLAQLALTRKILHTRHSAAAIA